MALSPAEPWGFVIADIAVPPGSGCGVPDGGLADERLRRRAGGRACDLERAADGPGADQAAQQGALALGRASTARTGLPEHGEGDGWGVEDHAARLRLPRGEALEQRLPVEF